MQYLEELEEIQAAKGAAALPGKRPLTPAEQAAAGGAAVHTWVTWGAGLAMEMLSVAVAC